VGRTRTGCPCCSSSVSAISSSASSSVSSISSVSSSSSSSSSVSSVSSSVSSSSVSSVSSVSLSESPSLSSSFSESSVAYSSSDTCCGRLPDTLDVLIKVHLQHPFPGEEVEGCENCYGANNPPVWPAGYEGIKLTLQAVDDPAVSASATEGDLCEGDGGLGKIWRVAFDTEEDDICLTCVGQKYDEEEEEWEDLTGEDESCRMVGGIQMVCCNDCSAGGLAAEECLMLSFWNYDFTERVARFANVPRGDCVWENICLGGFIDLVYMPPLTGSGNPPIAPGWMRNCMTDDDPPESIGYCNSPQDIYVVIYNETDTMDPNGLNDDCECPTVEHELSAPTAFKFRPVAMDAKTGKPLTFIASESRSE